MQAEKEWRVVTQFLEKLRNADGNETPIEPSADCESLSEIDYSMFNVKYTLIQFVLEWDIYLFIKPETGIIHIGLSEGNTFLSMV